METTLMTTNIRMFGIPNINTQGVKGLITNETSLATFSSTIKIREGEWIRVFTIWSDIFAGRSTRNNGGCNCHEKR